MKNFLLYIWQLPQNLLGLILLLFYHTVRFIEKDGVVFYLSGQMPSGISLGRYIILDTTFNETDMGHEYGHSIQSRYLGPFYLLIIGIPSIVGNIYDRIFHTPKYGWSWKDSCKWYYSQPWEKWADKLGDVERDWDYA